MENYVIRFKESEREAVLEILSRLNDVVINKVEEASVGITIQLDDSDPVYQMLLEKIAQELHPEVVVKSDGENAGSGPV